MVNKKQNLHRLPSISCVVWDYYLIWYLSTLFRLISTTNLQVIEIACRLIVPNPLQSATKAKISMFCHVGENQVVGIHDVSSLYHVPLLLESQGIVTYLQKRLELPVGDQIPRAQLDKGLSLSNRWKDLTRGSAINLKFSTRFLDYYST